MRELGSEIAFRGRVIQVAVKRFQASVVRRLLCFSLFWHALDIIWVALFTVVYLLGVRQ